MSRSITGFRKLAALAAVSALGLGLAACGGDPTEGEAAASDTIVIGSGDFPEAEIIGQIYAQALEAGGVKVETKLATGPRETYVKASARLPKGFALRPSKLCGLNLDLTWSY